MEKIVKGATKIKLASPKSKYVAPILSATHGGEPGVAEVFRTLQPRLRDSTWTIAFKSLIVVHLMIREGAPDVTLKYIAESPKRLAISNFTEVQTEGTNIRRYSDYLLERARAYRATKTDHVRTGTGKLKNLTVEKGLLRETETVQNQIETLVKCEFLEDDGPHNDIALMAFRLVTMDLLELFKVMNEGTINVLEHYFEMSRPDAERALEIYKTFAKQTNQVVQYLAAARKYETSTRLEVPKLKHAPTTLTSSLEEYLNDPDFEVNRRQYLVQQEAKKSGRPIPSTGTRSTPRETKVDNSFPAATTFATPTQQPRGPAPDLMDFFESIEQNQQPMAQQNVGPQQFNGPFPHAQQYQQTAYMPQQTGYNPFLSQGGSNFGQVQPQQHQQQPQSLQTDFTGARFGGYTGQPMQAQPSQSYAFQSPLSSIPQNGVANFNSQSQFQSGMQSPPQPIQPQQTSSNPFRQSMIQQNSPASAMLPASSARQSTNPFAKNTSPQMSQQLQSQSSFSPNGSVSNPSFYPNSPSGPQTQHSEFQNNSSFFSSPSSTSPPISQFSLASQIQPQKTGTNPFARNRPTSEQTSTFQSSASPILPNPTGSTNPFRQSAFVNQQTGQPWQQSTQGTYSGFDVNNVNTIPIFPRPGQS